MSVDVQVPYGGTAIRRRAMGSAPHGAQVGETPSSQFPVGARHNLGRGKASIRKGKQGQGSRKAVGTATKLSHGVTERYSAGYSAGY